MNQTKPRRHTAEYWQTRDWSNLSNAEIAEQSGRREDHVSVMRSKHAYGTGHEHRAWWHRVDWRNESIDDIAKRFGVMEVTVRKWRNKIG